MTDQRNLNLPADVARCPGGQCPLKLTCRRFLADPLEHWIRVVWLSEPTFHGDTCEDYMEVK